jgi:magnesium-transporting ATPase (P-type)
MKGADSIIMERLRKDVDQPYMKEYERKLTEYSVQGLRTLLFAMKVLDESEYEKIMDDLDKIAVMKNSKERRNNYVDEIETNFMAIGMTAVEDKLQDKVPECIANFIESNIKVWMLTGDKLETAENIGYSCSLVQKNFHKFYIRLKDDYKSKAAELSEWLNKREQGESGYDSKICVLIEGSALLELEKDPEIEKKIVVEGLSRSDSVICCRMNPKQKGKIVKMVKEYIDKITLGIGDGANDVNMIQEADIGIGLYGKEGLRAVQASDYALVEFQALWKLLFVHGRWSYIR